MISLPWSAVMAGVSFIRRRANLRLRKLEISGTWSEEVHLKFQFSPDLFYDGINHLWIQLNAKNQQATIGIDALGLETLGDLAYVTLPEVGAYIQRGKSIGTFEAAKMTSELIAPISGCIVARNDHVLRDPSLVNRNSYGEAWLIVVEPSDWIIESNELIHGDGVPSWVESEIERYQRQGWLYVS